MEFNDFLETSILLGYYKELLSSKQKMYMILHFEEDYSLSEIAKENNVSRQAVYDNIKRGSKLLKSYEEKIGFLGRERKILDKLLKLKSEYKEELLEDIISEFRT